jgi:hypothetical protein
MIFDSRVVNNPTKLETSNKVIKNGIGRLEGNVYKDKVCLDQNIEESCIDEFPYFSF